MHTTRLPLAFLGLFLPTAVRPASSLLPILGGLAAAACERPAAVPVVVRDSGGVRLVENAQPEWREGEAWRIGAEPLLEIGGDSFHWVVSALVLPDGSILVGESTGDVRLFDDAGRLVWRAGGQGEGPGEIRMLAALGMAGDSLWLYDYPLRRLTYLGRDGRLLGVSRLQTDVPNLLPVGRREDGTFVLAQSWRTGGEDQDRALGLRRDTVEYVRFSPDGAFLGTVARLPGREYVLGMEEGRLTMASPPFARAAVHAIRGNELIHGDQERWELGVTGDASTIIRLAARVPPLDQERVSREIERRLADAHAGEGPGLRRFLSELPVPPTPPAYGAIRSDTEGAIWLGPAQADTAWTVIDGDGRWLGEVVLPERFTPTHILRDRVIGVWRDPLDAEHLRVYALERRPRRR